MSRPSFRTAGYRLTRFRPSGRWLRMDQFKLIEGGVTQSSKSLHHAVTGAFWGARDSSGRAFMIQSRHDLARWFQQAPVLEGPARAGLGSGRQDRSTGARGRAAAPRQQQPAPRQPGPEGRDRPAQEPAAAPAVQTLRHGKGHPAAALPVRAGAPAAAPNGIG